MMYEKEELGRHLYLIEDITKESVYPVIEMIRQINDYDNEIDDEVISQVEGLRGHGIIDIEHLVLPRRQPIILEINSGGGESSAGFSLITAIQNSVTPIIGYVTGECMSMAVPILTTCDFRISTKFSNFMIHDISSGFGGKYNDFINSAVIYLDMVRKNYIEAVVSTTSLDEEKLIEIMDKNHDHFFTPEQALEYGLIHSLDEDITLEDILTILYESREENDDEFEDEEFKEEFEDIIEPMLSKENKQKTDVSLKQLVEYDGENQQEVSNFISDNLKDKDKLEMITNKDEMTIMANGEEILHITKDEFIVKNKGKLIVLKPMPKGFERLSSVDIQDEHHGGNDE